MPLDAIIDSLSARWTKSLLGVALSALGGFGVYTYTQITSWAEDVKQSNAAHDRKDQEQDLRLERLVLLIESTSKSVDKMAESLEKQADKRDERLRRMDRLLDVLERKGYNGPKKESE